MLELEKKKTSEDSSRLWLRIKKIKKDWKNKQNASDLR